MIRHCNRVSARYGQKKGKKKEEKKKRKKTSTYFEIRRSRRAFLKVRRPGIVDRGAEASENPGLARSLERRGMHYSEGCTRVFLAHRVYVCSTYGARVRVDVIVPVVVARKIRGTRPSTRAADRHQTPGSCTVVGDRATIHAIHPRVLTYLVRVGVGVGVSRTPPRRFTTSTGYSCRRAAFQPFRF